MFCEAKVFDETEQLIATGELTMFRTETPAAELWGTV
jgi:hypothetical protein